MAIEGTRFLIDGRPTYEGRRWNGHEIEGLLFNARLVQGIFDDLNPRTRERWGYPDTGEWDAEREIITNNERANDLLHYEYREPWRL